MNFGLKNIDIYRGRILERIGVVRLCLLSCAIDTKEIKIDE